ncbi:MAG TPA: histidine phosphatase family protein [Xanthobacteraceae bacterium]|jgi:phosphohistidine phosphatase
MGRLLLLRHSKTERAEPGERDRDRKLTARGRADAPAIGAYMVRHGLVPDVALTSPAARAEETFEDVASEFKKSPRQVRDERIYNASVETLVRVIREARQAKTLLLVGHNPGLHDLALWLIASGDTEMRERLNEKLPTSGLVVIDFAFDDWSRLHANSGRLERFVSPRSIEAATD